MSHDLTPFQIQFFIKHLQTNGNSSDVIRKKLLSLKKFIYWLAQTRKISPGQLDELISEIDKQQKILDHDLKLNSNKQIENDHLSESREKLGNKLINRLKIADIFKAHRENIPGDSIIAHKTPNLSSFSMRQYVSALILLIFISALGAGLYARFFTKTSTPFAFPTTLKRAGRIVSYQGRLTDSVGNPITSATNLRFKLYDDPSAGNNLYDSGACSITPDQDGIFDVLLGGSGYTPATPQADCGTEIPASVFSENANVYLETTVGSETLSPRQHIANVGYAMNAETLQGFPPGQNASNVPYINQDGDMLIAASNPVIASTYESENFTIASANSVTIAAADTGAYVGDVTVQATGSGVLKFRTGGGTDANTRLYISNGGNIGVGTTNPTNATLDVVGSGRFSSTLTAANGLSVSTGALNLTSSSGSVALTLNSSTKAFNVNNVLDVDTSNSRVGVGTTAPTQALDVAAPSANLTFSSGTGPHQIITGGSTNLALMPGGNVGVGYTAPGSKFVVSGGIGIGTTSASSLYLSTKAPDGGLIVEGNVGIGTTNPSLATLDVAGTIRVGSTGAAASNQLCLGTNNVISGCSASSSLTGSGTTNFIARWTGSSSLGTGVLYDNGTNVGIGITSPNAKLSINGGVLLGYGEGTPAGPTNGLAVNGNVGIGTTSTGTKLTVSGGLAVGTSSPSSSYLSKLAPDGGAIFEGNVGVGTTAPVFKLDVNGSLNIGTGSSYSIGSTSVLTATTLGTGVTGSSLVQVGALTSGSIATGFGSISTANNISTTSTGTITSAGLLTASNGLTLTTGALNLTSSSGSAPLTLSSSSKAFYINNVFDVDTTNTRIGIGTTAPAQALDIAGASANLTFSHATGPHQILTGGTTDLSLMPGGNVGVGTTGSTLAKLDVNGTIRVGTTAAAASNPLCLGTNNVIAGCNSSSSLTGSGTANFVARWTSSTNLSTGVLYDNGTNVGIGVTTPNAKLQINGGTLIGYGEGTSGVTANSLAVNGNIGVGTTSPTQALDLAAASANLTFSSGTGLKQIITGGSTNLALMPGGNVGVGITSPNAKLAINGGTLIGYGEGTTGVTANSLAVNGNIGIGITSPTEKLDVVGNANISSGSTYKIGGTSVLSSTSLGTGVTGSSLLQVGALNSGSIASGFGTISTGNNITTTANISTTGTGTITSAGALTASNGFTLTTGALNLTSSSGSAPLTLSSSSKAFYINNVFDVDTANTRIGIGTTAPNEALDIAGAGANLTFSHATGPHQIKTGGTTDLSLMPGGNVGIGSTGATLATLDVNGTIRVGTTGAAASNPLCLGTNNVIAGCSASSSLSGSGTSNYIARWTGTTSLGTGVLYDNGTNVGIGITSPNAKLAINGGVLLGYGEGTTGVTANSLAVNGNIGIGITSPTEKLDVVGNANISSGSTYKIGGTNVLSSTSLGTGVTGSSLVQVGALNSGSIASGFGTISTGNNISTSANISTTGTGTITSAGTLTASNGFTLSTGALNLTSSSGSAPLTLSSSSKAFYINNVFDVDTTNTRIGIGTTAPSEALDLASAGADITFSHATGPHQILTGGTTDLSLMPGGNVGIGTTGTTLAKLDVNGTIRVGTTAAATTTFLCLGTNNVLAGCNGGGGTVTGTGSTNYLARWTSSSALGFGVIADNGTNVGIGTTAGSQRLDLAGANDNIIFSSATGPHQILTGGSTNLALMPGGNVGVGTTAPVFKLDVNGSLNIGTGSSYSIGSTSVLTATTLGTGVTGSSLVSVGALNSGSIATGFGNISTANNISTTSTGTITSAGTLTASNGLTLTTGALNLTSSSGSAPLTLSSSSKAFYINNVFDVDTANTRIGIGTTAPAQALDIAGASANLTFSHATGPHQILTGGTTDLSLMPGGNVGVGTTGSTLAKLDVNGTIRVGTTGAAANSNYLCLGTNSLISGCSGNVVSGTGATNYVARWTSSTALGIGTLFDNGTNVGIGITSPNAKLAVNGGVLIGYGEGTTGVTANSLAVGGNIGVGTTSPTVALDVNGTINGKIFQDYDNTAFGLDPAGTTFLSSYSLRISSGAILAENGGNVGIGTTNPSTGKLQVNGNIRSGDGTRSAVAYGFSSEGGDTGMYLSSDNNLAFANGGSDTLFIRSDGAVGIGTTNPSTGKLQVNGTIRGSDGSRSAVTYGFSSEGGDTGMYLTSDNNLAFASAGSDRLFIKSDGNIGIGTTAPSEVLDISGAAANLTFSHATGAHQIKTGGTTNLALMPGGNVGVGTTTAGAKLTIAGTFSDYGGTNSNTGSGYQAVIVGGSAKATTADNNNLALMSDDALASNPLTLNLSVVGNTAAASRYSAIQSGEFGTGNFRALVLQRDGGNLGIGISGPTAKLHLNGGALIGYGETTTGVSSNSLAINGNLGIGTTSPAYKIDAVNATLGTGLTATVPWVQLTGSSSGNSDILKVVHNRYLAGSGWQGAEVKIMKTVDVSDMHYISFRGDTAAAASKLVIGNTFNGGGGDQVTVDNVGNVGIGTTSPVAKLEVVGNIYQSSGVNALGSSESMAPNSGFEINSDGTTTLGDGWGSNNDTGSPTYNTTTSSPLQGDTSQQIILPGGGSATGRVYSLCFPVSNSAKYFGGYIAKNSSGTATVAVGIEGYGSKSNCTSRTGKQDSQITSRSITSTTANLGTGISASVGVGSTARWGRAYVTASQTTATTVTLDSISIKPDFQNNGVDLAENFPVLISENIQPGEVMSTALDEDLAQYALRTQKAYDSNILGVVSTKPGIVLDDGKEYERKPIALTGRVPVKVSSENGKINIGDYLTSSSIPGVAMKQTKAGMSIGRALTSYSGNDIGEVIVFVNTHLVDPGILLTSTGDLKIDSTELAKEYNYNGNLAETNSSILNGVYSITDSAGTVIDKVGAYSQLTVAKLKSGLIQTQNAVVENTLSAKNIIGTKLVASTANIVDATIEKVTVKDKITSPVIETKDIVASGSAEIAQLKTDEIKPQSTDLTINIGTTAAAETSGSTGPLGKLVIKGLQDREVASIDASGNATFSGTIASAGVTTQTLNTNEASISGKIIAKEVQADNITKLNEDVVSLSNDSAASNRTMQQLSNDINDVQTLLGQLKNQPLTSTANYQNLNSEQTTQLNDAVVTGKLMANNLTVGGNTNLFNATVTNTLTAGNIMIENNAITSLAWELKLSALSTINLFDGQVTIAKDGTITTQGAVVAQGGVKTNTIQGVTSNDNVSVLLNSTKENNTIRNSKFEIRNSDDNEVASVDASGSAHFATVAANGLSIKDKYMEATSSGAIIAAYDNFTKNGLLSLAIETQAQTAGIGKLPENEDSIVIYNNKITSSSLVYLTPSSSTAGTQLTVVEKHTCNTGDISCRPYFKVKAESLLHPEIIFDWLIVN